MNIPHMFLGEVSLVSLSGCAGNVSGKPLPRTKSTEAETGMKYDPEEEPPAREWLDLDEDESIALVSQYYLRARIKNSAGDRACRIASGCGNSAGDADPSSYECPFEVAGGGARPT